MENTRTPKSYRKNGCIRNLLLLLASAFALSVKAPGALLPIASERIEEISTWLSPAPSSHFLPSFSHRAFWTSQAETSGGQAMIDAADAFSSDPIPELTETLFDIYTETGRREPFEVPYGERINRLSAFVFAFGMTGLDKYLPLIENELGAILDEPSWALPAHSAGRGNWAAAYDNIGIASATRVWSLATTDWLMGDHLLRSTRERIRTEARARVFDPYLERSRTNDLKDFWWMNTFNNWNAICNASIMGSALLLCESPLLRAEFIAAFEVYTKHYLDGFTSDGFCDEGVAYWDFGFRHYLMGSEAIRLATSGQLDLMQSEKIKKITAFDQRWEIANGIFPAFGDAWFHPKLSPVIHDYTAIRFNSGYLKGIGDPLEYHMFGSFMYQILFDMSLPRDDFAPAKTQSVQAIRDWFPEGGALISRCDPADQGLAIAFKGGHNAQSHNHNDLGSFVVVVDGVLVLTDLGADAYTKDTFGPNRYDSEILNSYGHPVPLVAGQLQKVGADARAVTLFTEFTDEKDTWVIDLTSAYDVPELIKLTRTFIFTRKNGGRLEVIDDVRFSSPQSFGNAIMLRRQDYASQNEQSFRVSVGDVGVLVRYEDLLGAPMILSEDRDLRGILKDEPSRGIRLGLDTKSAVTQARVRITIEPLRNAPILQEAP